MTAKHPANSDTSKLDDALKRIAALETRLAQVEVAVSSLDGIDGLDGTDDDDDVDLDDDDDDDFDDEDEEEEEDA